MMTNLDDYITCALWSSTDDKGMPLDSGTYELAEETRVKMENDLHKFAEQNCDLLTSSGLSEKQWAHNFWLSRNRHGSGFFDEEIPRHESEPGRFERIMEALQDAARNFGEADLYIGDDGKIYQTP